VIVPSKLLEKAQYAAQIIRPRLQALLKTYLFASTNPHARFSWKAKEVQSLALATDISDGWKLDRTVSPVSQWRGGSREAQRLLKEFVKTKLRGYATKRNKPEVDHTSRLSPYLHFGHINPITVALAVEGADAPSADKKAFLDQMITWRELAINLVRFNANYDNFECGEPWAHRTLAKHAKDHRPVLYSEAQL